MLPWRKGEITSLEWDDVDRKHRIVRLRPEHSKNEEGRVLVLEGTLWDVIEQLHAVRCCRWVFHRNGERIKDFRKAWNTACRKAGITGKIFHDLRRTAIRNMTRAGVPRVIAKRISGHKTDTVFERYDIVDENDLREAARRTQEYLRTRTKPGQ